MVLPSSSVEHYRTQQAIAVGAAQQAKRLWAGVRGDFDASWAAVRPAIIETVSAAQMVAASTGAAYVGAVVVQQGIDAAPVATVNPVAFAGWTSEGNDLDTLLTSAVTEAKTQVAAGASQRAALTAGGLVLEAAILDSVRSANRQAVSAGMTVRPALQGWVRMVNPPSCKFCIMLAGKWFRWNEGFQSHPHCDCRHIPSQEAAAGDLTVDPYAYFRSLDETAQNRIFGKRDAQAIRDGGDIYRVVNIRSRGLGTGRQARKYGTPMRATVDDIYARAATRQDAIRMLTEEGYVTGPQRAGGNIRGNENTNAALLARGRGRGTYRVGSEIVTTRRAAQYDAVLTGQRDPLNRATMTAGERRIYDDFYRAEQALLGRRARTIGGNSADRGTVFTSITEEEADVLRMTFIRRIERVRRNGSAQEKRIAERLWARYNALI